MSTTILRSATSFFQTVATGKLDPKKTIATELAVWKKLVAERKIVVDI